MERFHGSRYILNNAFVAPYGISRMTHGRGKNWHPQISGVISSSPCRAPIRQVFTHASFNGMIEKSQVWTHAGPHVVRFPTICCLWELVVGLFFREPFSGQFLADFLPSKTITWLAGKRTIWVDVFTVEMGIFQCHLCFYRCSFCALLVFNLKPCRLGGRNFHLHERPQNDPKGPWKMKVVWENPWSKNTYLGNFTGTLAVYEGNLIQGGVMIIDYCVLYMALRIRSAPL